MSRIVINDLEKSEGFINSLTDQEIQNIVGSGLLEKILAHADNFKVSLKNIADSLVSLS